MLTQSQLNTVKTVEIEPESDIRSTAPATARFRPAGTFPARTAPPPRPPCSEEYPHAWLCDRQRRGVLQSMPNISHPAYCMQPSCDSKDRRPSHETVGRPMNRLRTEDGRPEQAQATRLVSNNRGGNAVGSWAAYQQATRTSPDDRHVRSSEAKPEPLYFAVKCR